ncbi:unnamed protein product [Rangifer tarandus platyrhynchus]|uniref:Uncharacterized protein n=1 Tax=Rangifer tarandus platyrhynchus TaxID=3082113 RepID=A0ABN8Y6L5_RANTA|nr:unnamed protein product [Rangifer tarandus platyrhynchus]
MLWSGSDGGACGARNGAGSAWIRASLPGPAGRRRGLVPGASFSALPPRPALPAPQPLPCPGGALSTPLCFLASLSLESPSKRHMGKQECGQALPSPGLVCFFPSCQLLSGAQIMYSSKFNINGFTVPFSFRANMQRSTENSPASDQEKSWVISSRGAGGFRGNPCPRVGSADSSPALVTAGRVLTGAVKTRSPDFSPLLPA